MANIQIGKYKRPGIFIEEFDQSIITSPTVEGITNLVIGVSKKGPVNTPVRLTNIGDLEAIFGQLDRNLERKGSFFHRTISKMLETSPVFAINLLLTDDNLDLVEYKSLSTSTNLKNDSKKFGPYRRFFDTTGFWKRDSESFINLTKANQGHEDRILNFSNLSDRPISIFAVKTTLSGFDRTVLEWYGSEDKMPTFLNQQDFASDYMIDVVVVGGNWSNYQDLSVDPRWSKYFNPSGLRKEQLRNFANDRNINLLAFYEGLSLIPNFRDLNGRNLFIETVINRDTDRTGLFCALNTDLVEDDYYNGKIDLIGNTIVGKNETDIDFLSYKESISEEIQFNSVPLDLPGNVTGLLGNLGFINQPDHAFGSVPLVSGFIKNTSRTAWFSEGSVAGVSGSITSSNTSNITVEYLIDNGAYAVISNRFVEFAPNTASFTITSSNFTSNTSNDIFYIVFVLKENGEIKIEQSNLPNIKPLVMSSDIVLGYLEFSLDYQGQFGYYELKPVTVDESGFSDLVNTSDYIVDHISNGSIKITFLDTSTSGQLNTSEYEKFRKIKAFNRLVSVIDSPNKQRVSMNLGPENLYKKVSLANVTITNIVQSNIQNKSFVLNTGLSESELSDIITNGYLVFYTNDNEFILGQNGAKTKNTVATFDEGVVSKFSTFYSRFFDGIINTRDFFYSNRLYVDSTEASNALIGETVDVTFYKELNTSSEYVGLDFIVFHSDYDLDIQLDLQPNEQLLFPTSNKNKGSFTLSNSSTSANDLAVELGFSGNSYAFSVEQSVVEETLTNVNKIYDFINRNFLKMYLENNSNLVLEITDELSLPISVNTIANDTFFVQSKKSNLKQTVEIEQGTAEYIQVPNKILINAARYTEIKIGDFLEASFVENELEFGEVPRKLTRIISKKQFAGDTSLVELTCDSEIKKYDFSGDLQTMRYVSIDNYASTFKCITLNGFRMRQNSLPDGTEAKQNQILNLISKGTPLFKSLTNKEAFDFRYLIDAFGLGLSERSKQQLLDIVGERLDSFAFINMPSLRDFKNSSSPSFVNNEGVLQVEFIASGGDPESNPAFLYSFGDGVGTTSAGYFTPYLTVNDNGRELEMPPASHVATAYMRKHISNITSIAPWTIAAGVTNGRITNIAGIEIDFDNEDIEYLNLAQMNPIVFKRNRGFIIETENTAQTLVNSSLSFIHSREVLIELERELSRMLLDYQWRFNTPDVRAEIKLRADVICETFVNRNGLFNYFNKMDDENNTSEIIDNQIGVLDTFVEVIKGMGVIVNNITILRTGAIQAGGFINP